MAPYGHDSLLPRNDATATRSPHRRALALAVVIVGAIGVSLLSVSYRVILTADDAVMSANVQRRTSSEFATADIGNDSPTVPALTAPITISQCVNNDHIALTFDDGPTGWTSALLDIFARYDVLVTFFFLGANLEFDATNRQAAQLAFEQGHQVASHAWSHTDLTTLSADGVREELEKTSDVLQNVTGHRPRYMRPPYGTVNDVVTAVITEEGYKSVLWSCDSSDWNSTDEAVVTANLATCDLNRSLIILHDGRQSTAEAVEKFIVRVRAEYPEKKFVRADECSGHIGDDADVAE